MGTIKDVYDILKDLIKAAKEMGNQHLVEMALDVQVRLFDLKEENETLKDEIKNLKDELQKASDIAEIEARLIPHISPYYTLKDDIIQRCFCANCWNKKKVLIQGIVGRYAPGGCAPRFDCPECKTSANLINDDVRWTK